ncbi:hypothetical protein X798_05995, partial [Onchocerca flexuosa]
CLDGTQAAGACIFGQCGSSFTCINDFYYNLCLHFIALNLGLCCNVTNNTPRCLDGTPSAGACLFGHCGAGTCPNNATSIGICINGLCPTSYTCINGQCCPQSTNTTFRCSNLNYALGPCVGNQCPDDGFQCDTTINSCCPVSEPIGTCAEPGDQCPAGSRCFKEVTTPVCFKECDDRGTISGFPVDGNLLHLVKF